jgi:hypothetical protein
MGCQGSCASRSSTSLIINHSLPLPKVRKVPHNSWISEASVPAALIFAVLVYSNSDFPP